MTITAKYPGRCATCGGEIHVGDQIEWRRGERPRHTHCPAQRSTSAPVALVAGGAQVPRGRNRRAAHCDRCGQHLAAGEGSLVRCIADTGCLQHHDEDGWHVYCVDEAACGTRRAERRAAAAARKAEAQAAAVVKRTAEQAEQAAYRQIVEERTAGLVRIPADTGDAREGDPLARCDSGFYRTALYARVGSGYYETATGHDDWRSYVWVSTDEVLVRGRRLLAEVGVDAVHEFLATYDGCHGAELYRAAAWAAGE